MPDVSLLFGYLLKRCQVQTFANASGKNFGPNPDPFRAPPFAPAHERSARSRSSRRHPSAARLPACLSKLPARVRRGPFWDQLRRTRARRLRTWLRFRPRSAPDSPCAAPAVREPGRHPADKLCASVFENTGTCGCWNSVAARDWLNCFAAFSIKRRVEGAGDGNSPRIQADAFEILNASSTAAVGPAMMVCSGAL